MIHKAQLQHCVFDRSNAESTAVPATRDTRHPTDHVADVHRGGCCPGTAGWPVCNHPTLIRSNYPNLSSQCCSINAHVPHSGVGVRTVSLSRRLQQQYRQQRLYPIRSNNLGRTTQQTPREIRKASNTKQYLQKTNKPSKKLLLLFTLVFLTIRRSRSSLLGGPRYSTANLAQLQKGHTTDDLGGLTLQFNSNQFKCLCLQQYSCSVCCSRKIPVRSF